MSESDIELLVQRAKAKGSDADFRRWIQKQPSCVSNEFSEYLDAEGRCIAAHYRNASNSGIGMKPEYSCIPLTNEEHMRQHAVGTFAYKPREWWEHQVEKYLILWIES